LERASGWWHTVVTRRGFSGAAGECPALGQAGAIWMGTGAAPRENSAPDWAHTG